MSQVSRILFTLRRHLLLVFLLFIVSYYFFVSSPWIIFRDERTFNKYINSRYNPKCPALVETVWNVYKEVTTPEVIVLPEERLNLSLQDLGLVTFTSKNHMKEAMINCASIKKHLQISLLPFTIFLSSDVTNDQKMQFKNACSHANIQRFPFEKFPKRVQTMDNYIFKPLYQSMAMRKHKALLSFDTSVLFNEKANFTDFIQSHVKNNPTDVTLLTTANHNMFSTTHPKMYDCFPNIDPKKMTKVTQYQATVILWIGSKSGWKSMTQFVECSLQENCLAPPGSTRICNMKEISRHPRNFSGCHRFDQAAINYILYENSNHQPKLYSRHTKLLRVARTKV
jgi:hypothetical protein